jgi:lipopolysaccharide transport system permease protein
MEVEQIALGTPPQSKVTQFMRSQLQEARILNIRPSRGWQHLDLMKVWQYRELLFFLSWRDIKVRYKQTLLGALWAVIQPLMTMVVFSLFFGKLAKMPSDGIPYPLFVFTALVPWTLFSNSLTQSSNSLVQNAHMLKKVYFPRLIIPISTVLSGVIDFIIAFGVLLLMMLFYRVVPTVDMIWVPCLVLLEIATVLGVGLWLSALNVQFRDVRYVVPFLSQFWLFTTPIAYPSSLLTEPWRTVYGLNPMVGVVEGFRSALLGLHPAPGPVIIVSSCTSLMILISGLFYFRRMERTFADTV